MQGEAARGSRRERGNKTFWPKGGTRSGRYKKIIVGWLGEREQEGRGQ